MKKQNKINYIIAIILALVLIDYTFTFTSNSSNEEIIQDKKIELQDEKVKLEKDFMLFVEKYKEAIFAIENNKEIDDINTINILEIINNIIKEEKLTSKDFYIWKIEKDTVIDNVVFWRVYTKINPSN